MIEDIKNYLFVLLITGIFVFLCRGNIQTFFNTVACVALFRIVTLERKK